MRVSPAARRALKAHGDGLLVVCAGGVAYGYPHDPNSRYMIDDGIPDYDDIPPWYAGNPLVAERNARLKERMEKTQARKKSHNS